MGAKVASDAGCDPPLEPAPNDSGAAPPNMDDANECQTTSRSGRMSTVAIDGAGIGICDGALWTASTR